MRRTRRLLSADTTEVPVSVEEPHTSGVTVANTWAPPYAVAVAAAVASGVTEDDTAPPPLKRFKLPGEVLARLGKTAAAAAANDGEDKAADVANDDVAGVIQLRRAAAAKKRATAAAAAAVGKPKPVVSVRRTPRHQMEQPELQQEEQYETTDQPPVFFANSNDDVIRFGGAGPMADDALSTASSSWCDNEDGEEADGDKNNKERAARQEREIERHFAGYGSDELDSASDSLLREDEDEEDEDEDEEENGAEGDEEEEDGDTTGSEAADEDASATCVAGAAPAGFGLFERRRRQQQQQKQQSVGRTTGENGGPPSAAPAVAANPVGDRRYRYGTMFFETHVGRHGADPCHHTLLCLNGPITIQGPCGVMGFGIGEVAVGGFYIGRKQIVLHSDTQKVVMTPVTRLKNKSAGLESLPVPVRLQQQQLDGPIIVVPPSPLPGNSYVAAAAAAAGDDNDDENNTGANEDDNNDNVEVFGTIDWNWVEATVASWRGRFASKLPSVVLIVQPYDPCGVPPTRRHFFKRCPQKKQNQKKQQQQQQVEELPADAFIDVPRFVARRHEPGIDAALLPEVIPAIIKHNNGTVVVLGSQGIGKSTLARFLANGLLSQHGVCYWLDLDLGRPEFGPPGTLSLHRVCRPLLRPSDTACVELVRGHYLGGARLRCPLAAAAAVERLCAVVELLQRRYPVVVNTHGWVLSTGRRMTVEAIRRLQPRHIIHLVKEREQRWARDSEVLMHPANGLNSEVLHNRFLVHRAARSQVVGRFPHPHRVTDNRGAAAAAAAASATEWCGTVHTVQVKRDEGMLRRSMQPKASALRHAMWQQQLAPIFNYYEAVEMTKRRAKGSEAHLAEAETTTTLFKGMLSQFEAIVFTDVADARSMTEEAVCAALEHSVVALSFRIVPAAAATKQQHQQQQLKKNYRCLADMPAGFPFSCFGVVESSEAAMRASNEIHIRLPLPRDVVRRMLTTDGEGAHVRLSLACTLADRADTAALEAYL